METLLAIVDFVILFLLAIQIVRTVWMEPPFGSGSPVLSFFVALVLIAFFLISLGAYSGLVAVSSTLTRIVFLVVLLVMAVLLRSSSPGKSAA
jgi:hypothetical protein